MIFINITLWNRNYLLFINPLQLSLIELCSYGWVLFRQYAFPVCCAWKRTTSITEILAVVGTGVMSMRKCVPAVSCYCLLVISCL